MMPNRKVDVASWARGQRLAARRVAREAGRTTPDLDETLDRVDELRSFADSLGAKIDRRRAERENLAYHLTWLRLKQALRAG